MLDFLIVYEHKARELDNVCLLKAELELRGYSVEIIQSAELYTYQYRTKKKPAVLVTFALYDDESFEGHVTGVVGCIDKVVNLQWEQVLSGDLTSVKFHTPKGKAAWATHVCWGQESFERLKKSGVKNVVLTGAIQMDFLIGNLRNYYMSRQEMNVKYKLPQGKLVLYISSFVGTTATKKEQELTRAKIGNVVDTSKNIGIESKKKTLEIFDLLMEKNSEYFIVYRPHPGELIDETLELMMKKHRNKFQVISEDSVKQWILIADHIITWISTSIAEAYFAGRNCIVLRPVPVPMACDSVLFTDANIISDVDGLEKVLKVERAGFPIPSKNMDYYYGSYNDGKAYVRVVNLLEQVYSTTDYNIIGIPKRLYLGVPIKNLIKRMILFFHITSRTWPIIYIRRIREWLEFFEHYRKKTVCEQVTPEQIEKITMKLKQIIQ